MSDAAPRHAPRDCPVCGSGLDVSRLSCGECGTELAGRFASCEFCALGSDDRALLRTFLRSRGNMKEIERHLGVSYPTARARFDALLVRLDLSAGAASPRDAQEARERVATLEALADGDIDIDEALRRLP